MTSRLVVNSVRHTGASADALTLDGTGGVTIPTKKLICPGTIVQVVADIKKDTSSFATSSSFAATGMSVTITPQSASNKLLIIANLAIGNSGNNSTQWKLYRGTSEITAANSTGVTNKSFMWIFIPQSGDNPTYQNIICSGAYEHDIQDTNSHEINLYVNSFNSTAYLNRRGHAADYGGTSSLVVYEVSA
tara:strand:- start:323 stop:892 length:570 start_codon:yes stop_codon:yes gene_type:complete